MNLRKFLAIQVGFWSLLLLGSIPVHADFSVSQVLGQCEPFDYSVFKYTFKIRVSRPALPEGTELQVNYGFAGHGSVSSKPYRESFHWDEPSTVLLTRDSSGEYSGTLQLYYMATGGYYSDLEFRVQDDSAEYSALFFALNGFGCDKLLHPTSLKVRL